MKRPHEIDSFESYLERGDVKKRAENPSQAKSLSKRSNSKYKNMEKLGIEEETATDYLENLYEALKMLIQSFMALEGYKPYSHEAVVAYALDKLDIDMVDANTFNRYRKLRNDIVYRGETATVKEAENIKELYKRLNSDLNLKEEIQ